MHFIDTHIHIDQYKDHKRIYELMSKSPNYYLCVSNNVDIFNSLNYFYKEHHNIKFAVGANPQTLAEDGFDPSLFKECLKKTRYVGEIGLDFSSEFLGNKYHQLRVFETILSTVKGTNKILSIHCNNAEQEVYELLKKYNLGKQSIIHWFSGDFNKCKLLSSLDCYFSINGNMTEKTNFQNLVKEIGLNRILVESDGPHTKLSRFYNEKSIEQIYKRINDVLKVDDFELIVYKNFQRFLSIK